MSDVGTEKVFGHLGLRRGEMLQVSGWGLTLPFQPAGGFVRVLGNEGFKLRC